MWSTFRDSNDYGVDEQVLAALKCSWGRYLSCIHRAKDGLWLAIIRNSHQARSFFDASHVKCMHEMARVMGAGQHSVILVLCKKELRGDVDPAFFCSKQAR